MNVLAQKLEIGNTEIQGPLKSEIQSIWDIISIVLNFGMGLVGIILVAVFISAGYDFITSGGNPDKVSSARKKLTSAVIGVVLLSSAFLIVRLVSYILNLQAPGF